MNTGKDVYDQTLLDSLEKKYQLFLDSPNGEINVFLVLSKFDEEGKDELNIGAKSTSEIRNSNIPIPMNFNNVNNSMNFHHNNNNSMQTTGHALRPNKSFKNFS
jgi:hypothetical protein